MKIKYIKSIAIALVAALAIACSESLERANYVAFESKTAELVTPATGSGSAELKVYTTKSGSSRTFSIEIDEANTTADLGSIEVPETVTVPAGDNVGTFTVTSDAANIGKKIVLKFIPTESTIVGASMTVNIYEECLENLLFLDLLFDNYPEEFAWQIFDSDDNFVAGNEDFGDYAGKKKAQLRVRICLPDGDYTFAAYDAYGDGMSDGSNIGKFSLRKVSDGSVLVTDEGDFGFSSEGTFSLP